MQSPQRGEVLCHVLQPTSYSDGALLRQVTGRRAEGSCCGTEEEQPQQQQQEKHTSAAVGTNTD